MRLHTAACLVACLTTSCATSDLMREVARPSLKPDPSFATVVFLRPSTAAPNTLVTLVDGSGRFLGESESSSCFATKVEPGKHLFVGWAANTTALSAELEAGKVYYVEVVLRLGSLSSRANLFAVKRTREEAAQVGEWLKDCTFFEPDQVAGQAWLTAHETERVDRVRKAEELVARFTEEDRKRRALRSDDGRTE